MFKMNYRLLFAAVLFVTISCSKKTDPQPPAPIPDIIIGKVADFNVTPIDINTPDKGVFKISMNNTMYKVVFNAVAKSESNAVLAFAVDTILTDQSREYANLGKDIIAYNPLKENEITLTFAGGRKISGLFETNTNFVGTFGEALINQWRDSVDPTKPNQKAKDDIRNFVYRYDDADGPGPGTDPVFLSAQVTRN
jgi:hypothetical protein